MVISTSAPIKRALVRRLRDSATIGAAIRGGIHETLAPKRVRYPFIQYTMVTAPYVYDWDHVEIHALVDVSVFAENPVDANNIDALIVAELHEATLSVDGQQRTLRCQRVSDIPTGGASTDATGRRIYRAGGSYSIWTDQPRF